jgi:(2Fe-2S) ferredoxin
MSTGPQVLSRLRYHVFVCVDAGSFCGCEANGSGDFLVALRKQLVKRRLMPFVKTTLMNCNQPGAHGPVVVVHPDGVWYDGLTAEDVEAFIETQLLGGQSLSSRLMQSEPQTGHSAY